MRNLSSMIRTNSHDYPEIKLNSSSIFFSGSENSPEKMKVISIKFGLELNYNMIIKDAFEACKQNFLCSQQVPSKMSVVNEIALELMNQEGLSRQEKNRVAEDFMNKALYDGDE